MLTWLAYHNAIVSPTTTLVVAATFLILYPLDIVIQLWVVGEIDLFLELDNTFFYTFGGYITGTVANYSMMLTVYIESPD